MTVMNRPGFTGGQNSRRIAHYGTVTQQEDLEAFPWHPHRGIETITYVLEGSVEHSDSLGNTGALGAGDIQWMTAGSGILHQEMPTGNARGQMHGFQLWANLPGSLKMTAPRYQDVGAKETPEIIDDDGTVVKVVIGEFWGRRGPVDGIAADPLYLDIRVPAGLKKRFKVDTYGNPDTLTQQAQGVGVRLYHLIYSQSVGDLPR